MYKIFVKENIFKTLKVENNKVFTTIVLNGYNITNPTLDLFLSLGWKEYIPESGPEPEPYLPTLEELVEQKIRERYSINQEFEVQRRRFREPEAFEEYDNFVEECIASAKQELESWQLK